MNLLRRTPSFRALLGVSGALSLGVLVVHPPLANDVEVGPLDPVYAGPAEVVEVRALGRGQTLGEVLAETLDANQQQALVMAFREQASPRRMRVGTEILLRYLPEGVHDDDRSLRAVDVLLNPDSTVRLTRHPLGWSSATVETETYTDTIYASGEIETDLWTAVVTNPALEDIPVRDRALLIHHLDQIFQWQVDFSRQIRAEDHYRFVFERHVRPDGSMRAGHVLAAELVNGGGVLHAVRFDPNGDGEGHYYDLEGKSVRRAFLLKPLEFRRISSGFTRSRFHPILRTWRAHQGVDYAADRGTPIMTTADGVVTHAGPKGSLGNAVIIRHSNGFVTRYGHMSRVATGIRPGVRVRQEQTIGYVGSTGLANGPHLHYELWRNGTAVDPLTMDLPKGDPVPTESRDRWESDLSVRVALLERLPGPVSVRVAAGPTRSGDAAPDDRPGSY